MVALFPMASRYPLIRCCILRMGVRIEARVFCGANIRGWKFQIDAHAVSQIANLFQKFIGSVRNSLYMNIAIETIFVTQQEKSLIHQFHCVSWIFVYGGT